MERKYVMPEEIKKEYTLFADIVEDIINREIEAKRLYSAENVQRLVRVKLKKVKEAEPASIEELIDKLLEKAKGL